MIIDDDGDNDEIIDILYTCIPIKRLLVQANNITIDFAFTYSRYCRSFTSSIKDLAKRKLHFVERKT